MKPKAHKNLILSLLLDDLVYTRLIEGLTALNLQPQDYSLDLGDKVIKLMGFRGKQNEVVYEYYLSRREQVQFIDLSRGNAEMKALAANIYLYL